MSRRQLREKYRSLWAKFAGEPDLRKRQRIQKRAEAVFRALSKDSRRGT